MFFRQVLSRRPRWWVALVFVASLLGCSGGTPDDPAPYAFALERDMLTMRDGVRLGVTYYRPTARAAGETFPVIMEMVPYRKDDFFALGDYEYGAWFARRGYVLARVDVRGTGASEGPIPVSEYSQAEIADAVELVGQLAAKPWANGKVGMYGVSWSAFNSLMTAQRKPPALKAIIAAHGSTDLFYNDVHYIDGVLHLDYYAHQIDTDNSMPQSPDYALDDAYFRNRFDREPWLFTWMRQQQDGSFWRQESVGLQGPLEVPAYLIGGLLDGYRDFVLDVKRNARAPVIAEIGPWNHAWPEYGSPGPNYEWREKALRWWDYWLKDKNNGVLDEPRWTAFMRTWQPPATDRDTVPGQWRCEKDWPVPGSSTLQLFAQAGHGLTDRSIGAAGADSLVYRAGTGMAGGNWWGEQTGDMAADDAHSLVYDTPPLTQAVEIMGQPQVQLRVVADAPMYQWTVRLEDVAPSGEVTLISGALINPAQRFSRLSPQPLVPGEAVELAANIHFTTWRFEPGHRIRLAVSNAQFPMAWPSPTAGSTQLLTGSQTWLKLPVVPPAGSAALACSLPPPEKSEQAPFGRELYTRGPQTTSVRDEATGTSTVTTQGESAWKIDNNHYQSKESYRWQVRDADPAHARFEGERRNVFTIAGREIDLATQSRIESDATMFHVTFTKRLLRNGTLVRERTWSDSIPRNFQ
ncbi:CocE/NonD family hydrolase [Melaminivora sp.]|uniref:CocE/NonD family hydrolase n=1 Tax=Melaminivora sp. TaxID=1933032 RepID=UPI0028AAC2FF|nr:CocE/NonD family hydrolase [Melaminivora sp.]